VALYVDGEVATRELLTARDHAREVLPMLRGLLSEAGIVLSDLDGLAFGRGPGSFTGLRIAASVAQGLAFGAGLPVLPVSDLRALALQALACAPEGLAPTGVVACLDARMQEVYGAFFPVEGVDLPGDVPERVVAPGSLAAELLEAGQDRSRWLSIGKGFEAYGDSFEPLGIPRAQWMPQAEPRAREIVRLAVVDFEAGGARSPEEAVPVYLRDKVAKPSAP
jgi:tRNA threonylcarbamoyladenosine biosynthesis protein TsaB